ncbi:MAG TPA: BlaI/MecI/CopY family transcriptional regulator [Dinghuibacter sp.]|uniref:BlaI/MecI/CopY family transcriptional regulator n=1 Tax=Dinghuibacter sp. TaxID=2024697 RepID=UPI002BE2588A|nr:BlaI/MecI/CopY family transcriptional regulator [Dinghuibacter sp.]HTJ10892.1 BlaI/MecI/CopY family transcriptional regulator [Dinghuibacter sp.]
MNHPEPTKSELEILQVLWSSGPSTARQINDHINRHTRQVIYMSTLKLMQIMVEKGLLVRDESARTHVYRAAVDEGKTKTVILDKMVDTLFNGSAGSLMMHLLGNKQLTPAEMAEYRRMLDSLDAENGGGAAGNDNKSKK